MPSPQCQFVNSVLSFARQAIYPVQPGLGQAREDSEQIAKAMPIMGHNKPRHMVVVAAAIGSALITPAAIASSHQAWQEFRADVARACRAAADDGFDTQTITVDPFGSQHYGLARLTGHALSSTAQQQLLCAYDKQTQTAEVGTPMAMSPSQSDKENP
ncbi:hypothetical protein V5738_04845 [Salinisphaera sp. SPP-AMP-43]|uniref:hypothetical protein n=1 Tax=Salinisphaera sp. SPP-AMP-43 TaxID=3121288 RepID=UPI003C6E32D0